MVKEGYGRVRREMMARQTKDNAIQAITVTGFPLCLK